MLLVIFLSRLVLALVCSFHIYPFLYMCLRTVPFDSCPCCIASTRLHRKLVSVGDDHWDHLSFRLFFFIRSVSNIVPFRKETCILFSTMVCRFSIINCSITLSRLRCLLPELIHDLSCGTCELPRRRNRTRCPGTPPSFPEEQELLPVLHRNQIEF
jgi:hypothetical protein